jgi:hypothetical protein
MKQNLFFLRAQVVVYSFNKPSLDTSYKPGIVVYGGVTVVIPAPIQLKSWGCKSAVECLPGMSKALGSMPSTAKNKNKNKVCTSGRCNQQVTLKSAMTIITVKQVSEALASLDQKGWRQQVG